MYFPPFPFILSFQIPHTLLLSPPLPSHYWTTTQTQSHYTLGFYIMQYTHTPWNTPLFPHCIYIQRYGLPPTPAHSYFQQISYIYTSVSIVIIVSVYIFIIDNVIITKGVTLVRFRTISYYILSHMTCSPFQRIMEYLALSSFNLGDNDVLSN